MTSTWGASRYSSVVLNVVSVETGLVLVVCVFWKTFCVNIRKYFMSPTDLKCGEKGQDFRIMIGPLNWSTAVADCGEQSRGEPTGQSNGNIPLESERAQWCFKLWGIKMWVYLFTFHTAAVGMEL